MKKLIVLSLRLVLAIGMLISPTNVRARVPSSGSVGTVIASSPHILADGTSVEKIAAIDPQTTPGAPLPFPSDSVTPSTNLHENGTDVTSSTLVSETKALTENVLIQPVEVFLPVIASSSKQAVTKPLTHTLDPHTSDSDESAVDVFNGNIQVGAPSVWKLSPAMGSVNTFRGSSNYAYSFEAPETVAGLQPALSIEYSSAAADLDSKGLLGRGWDMELPRISRVYKLDSYLHWVPSYVEIGYGDWYWANPSGTASVCDEGNSFFISDTLGMRCGPLWRWSQSAFAKLDFGTTPLYVLTLNGQTYPLVHVGGEDSGEYVPRTYSLLRVRQCNEASPCTGSLAVPNDTANVAHFSKEYWQVFTPDGLRYVFGVDDQSEQVIKMAAHSPNTPSTDGTVAWYLRRVYANHNDSIDPANHKFTAEYTYTQDHESSGILDWDKAILLANVVYGDSSKAGRYRLDFAYQGGSDDRRLSSVKLFKVGNATPEQETDFAYYSGGTYDKDLQTIQVKAQSESLPAITFSYTNQPSSKPILLAVDNGYGGRTEYEYEAVSGLEKSQRRVTKEWTKIELNGTTSTVSLRTFEYGSVTCVEQAGTSCYSGYTIEDSKALVGHDEVTAISRDPDDNAELNVMYTKFHLDLKRVGQAYQNEQQTAVTRQSHSRTHVDYTIFEADAGLPSGVWFSVPTTQTEYPNVIDAPGLFSVATTRYTGTGAWQNGWFLGQSLESNEWGNVTPSAGIVPYRHQETSYTFAYDTSISLFLLRPASTRRYDGATLVTEVLNYYDGSAVSPGTLTHGDLTQAQYTTNLPVPKTITVAFQYNSSGQLIQQTMASRTATIQYDPQFSQFVLQVTDAAGTSLAQTMSYEYYGLNESTTDGSGPFGALKVVTDTNAQSTRYAYDAFGRLIKLVKPGDTFTYPTQSTDYGDMQGANKPLRVTSWQREVGGCASCMHATFAFYDGLGRTMQTKTEMQNGSQVLVSSTDYDPLGRTRYQSVPEYLDGSGTAYNGYIAPVWGGLRRTETRYDNLGRVYEVIGPDGNAAFTAYREDGTGLSVATLDANGHKQISTSDVFGRLVQVQELTGTYTLTQPDFTGSVYATMRYGYDGRDNLTVVTDTLGNTTTITYDGYGHKTGLVDPDMGQWAYDYDARGNLISQTDGKNQVLYFAYDILDRLIEKRVGNASGTLLASFLYDQGANGIGRRTQATGYEDGMPLAVRSWSYDARGRTVTETVDVDGKSFVMNYAYDAADRMTSMTYPADEYGERETVTTGFDDGMRPVTLTSSMQTAPYVGRVIYNPLGQVTQTTFGSVLTRWNGYYGYDTSGSANFGRLYQTCVTRSNQGTCVGESAIGSQFKLELNYDAAGNITGWRDQTPESETMIVFDYDPLDRLTSVSTTSGVNPINEAYNYDAIGNLTKKGDIAQSYDATGNVRPHAVQARSDGGAFQYDANGNMTLRVEVSGTAVTTYTQEWTIDNRLAIVTDTTSGAVTTYLYDADGNRILKNDPDGETLYAFDQYEWYSTTLPVAGVSPTGTLAVDGEYAGLRIRQRGDYGVVTFTAQADTHLSLYLGDLYQTSADYWVHAPDGTLIATARTDGQGPDLLIDPSTSAYSKLSQTGTYTVTVKPRDNRRGRYNLLLSSPVMVSSTLEMRTLAMATHVLTITRPAQDGLIEFYGQAGRDIAIDLLQASNPAEVTLYRPDGNVVIPPLGDMSEVMPLDMTGVYTLRVNPLRDALGIYQFKLIVLVPVAQQAIATTYETACHTASNGGVECWGANLCSLPQHFDCVTPLTTGLLGISDIVSSSVPLAIPITGTRLVTVTENVSVADLAACALDHWGRHYCWGLGWGNTWGGNVIHVTVVNDFHPTSGLAEIAHGEYHVCVLTRRGDVYCGGVNADYGMLGIGQPNVLSRQVLVPVSDTEMMSGTVAIASDYMHTCAILRDDRIKCWGYNGNGQLGDGTQDTRYAPTQVLNLGGIPIDLALGEYHSCAVMIDGSVKCWGDGVVTPTTVLNQYITAVRIYGSAARQCIRDVKGVVACWGSSEGFDSLLYPWTVIGLEQGGASYVAATSGFACIDRSEGNYACWGKNNKGQLGDGTLLDRDIPLSSTVESVLPLTGVPIVVQVTRTAETVRLGFDGYAGGQYTLKIRCSESGSPGPSVYLIGPDRRISTSINQVSCAGNWGVAKLGPLTQDGPGIIEVRPYLYSTGTYTFTLIRQIINAGTLEVDGYSASLNIAQMGQTGQVTFTGLAGQKLGLGIDATGASATYVTIYRPEGPILSTVYVGGNSRDDIDTEVLTSSGNYTITLVPSGDGTGSYTMTLSSEVVGVPLEVDGNRGSVDITRLGQNGYLTFTGVAGQVLGMGLQWKGGGGYMTIYKPNGSSLASTTLYLYNPTQINMAGLDATGVYTIYIDPYDAGTGSYTMTLSSEVVGVPLEVDGNRGSVDITRLGQNGYLTFTGVAGQVLGMGLQWKGGGGYMTIYKPNGSSLASTTLYLYNPTQINMAGLDATGVYTIYIDPYDAGTGSYTMTLSSEVVGVPLEVDGNRGSVDITRLGQNGYLTFTGVAGQVLGMGLQWKGGGGYMTIYKPNGSSLASTTLYLYNPTQINMAGLDATGVYTIYIDPYDAGTGSYTMTLSTDASGTNPVINGDIGSVIISRQGQNGYAVFSGTTGQSLLLQTTFVGIGVTLSVLKPDGSQLDSWYIGSSPNTRNLPQLATTGTYTIYIDPYYAGTSTYTLTLTTSGLGLAPSDHQQLGEMGGRKVQARLATKAIVKSESLRPTYQEGPSWQQLITQLQSEGSVPANRYEVTKYYGFGGQRVAMRQAGNEVFYLFGDQVGSASLVADWHGDKISEVRYTPWGETRWTWELDGEGYTNRLYTSQLAQNRNYVGQLYDYGARFYSPVTGRFTSADSIIPQAGDPQGFNRYTYVNNSPLQYADPTGHCPMCVTAAIGAVAGAAIGAVMAAAPQAIANIQSGQPLFANIDPGEVARAAAVGAVSGAVAGLTMGVATAVVGTGFAGTVAAGAVSGVISGRAGKATENVLSGQDAGTDLLNAGDMARDAAMGAGGAALGYGVGKALGALCSFSADTPVTTDNGEHAIGTLRIGDHVLAYDEALGAIGYYTVTAVMVHDDPVIAYVSINSSLIETTPEHPFYTPMHGWVNAGDLWSGVMVRDAAGEYGVVQWVTSITRTQPMYNLTVAVAHTFFVGDGQWLVHNACPIPPGAKSPVSVEGEFSIRDWSGYPSNPNVPQPQGPFRILSGEEYAQALDAKRVANAALHDADPSLTGLHIHEIQPVKWGGSPTDLANKVTLPRSVHSEFTGWWASMLARITNGR